MYKILISDKVLSSLTQDIITQVQNLRMDFYSPSTIEILKIRTIETFEDLLEMLQVNPYYYPEYKGNIRIIIELYIPYLIFYEIHGNEVYITGIITIDEMSENNRETE